MLPSESLSFREFIAVLKSWPLAEPLPVLVEAESPAAKEQEFTVLDTISLAELKKALGAIPELALRIFVLFCWGMAPWQRR